MKLLSATATLTVSSTVSIEAVVFGNSQGCKVFPECIFERFNILAFVIHGLRSRMLSQEGFAHPLISVVLFDAVVRLLHDFLNPFDFFSDISRGCYKSQDVAHDVEFPIPPSAAQLPFDLKHLQPGMIRNSI